MLSVAKLVAGSEGYYLNTVASGMEEYYTGRGEAPGEWIGAACAELGLRGEVVPVDLSLVLRARSPLDLSPLTSRRIDSDKRVAGFDLTFSAPKSVSIVYGIGTESIREEVRLAHDEAVKDALAYLEAHAAFTRRGTNGVRRLETSGLVAALFRHRTSRLGDPQLHTHVLVANVVRGRDGAWSSLHARLLYHQGRTAGYVYQAALRAGLVDRLGLSFEPVVKGSAEVTGIPKGLVQLFSKRRSEIVAHLNELGTESLRAREVATLATRKTKGAPPEVPPGPESLRDAWRGEARLSGLDPDVVLQACGRCTPPEVSSARMEAIVARALGPDGLTAEASTFERRDVVRLVSEELRSGGRLPTIEHLADSVMTDRRLVRLGTEGRGGEELSTTEEFLSLESRLVERATARSSSGAGRVAVDVVDVVLAERPSIAPEQAEMVRRLVTAGDGIAVVVGKAGAGKTYALDAARAAWAREGFRVRGAALAARAAAELESGAGISSTTLARLLSSLDRGETWLGPRDIVVLDEAGMVGSRALSRLVHHVVEAGGKLVLVGDPRQLPEIEAGGMLRVLGERLGAIELQDNRRQEASWERAALDELRAGDVGAALSAYVRHGRVHLHDTAPGARLAMVRAWAGARTEGAEVRMYALRRADVEDLNALARLELRRRGELGSDFFVVDHHCYSLGDEVLFLRNDRGLKVLNGTRGKVVAASGSSLVVTTGQGERLVPHAYLEAGHLAHGYASTVHKAQGATVERAFVLGGDALYREAGYVAMSRAVQGTELFVVTSAFEGEPVPGRGDDPRATLRRALSTSKAKQLALESIGTSAEASLLERAIPARPVDPTRYRKALELDRERHGASDGSAGTAHADEERRVVEMEAAFSAFEDEHAAALKAVTAIEVAGSIRRSLRSEVARLGLVAPAGKLDRELDELANLLGVSAPVAEGRERREQGRGRGR